MFYFHFRFFLCLLWDLSKRQEFVCVHALHLYTGDTLLCLHRLVKLRRLITHLCVFIVLG